MDTSLRIKYYRQGHKIQPKPVLLTSIIKKGDLPSGAKEGLDWKILNIGKLPKKKQTKKKKKCSMEFIALFLFFFLWLFKLRVGRILIKVLYKGENEDVKSTSMGTH